MKVLVTGATGFVGSHLCDLLNEEGHEVYALVRSPKKAEEFKLKANYIEGNLEDLSWVNSLPNEVCTVIHTAGIVHSQNPNVFYKVNNQATQELVKNLKRKYQDLNFIFVSSLAAGGPSNHLESRTMSHSDSPVSLYGKSKLDAEMALSKLIPESWIYSCIRPPMVIGPRDPAVLDIFKMVKMGLVVGPGLNFKTKQYSFINVFDLVQAIYTLANERTSGKFYISHEESAKFSDIIKTIKSELDKKLIINLAIPHPVLKTVATISNMLPIPSRLTIDKVNELTQNSWVCSNDDLQEATGFKAKYDLRETVKMTTKDYRERGWL